MASKLFHQIFGALLLLLVLQLHLIECRPVKLESLHNLEQAKKGDTVKGLNQVKHFLKAFGYYTINANANDNVIEDDHFDEYLESSLQAYQKFYNLEVTGKIDSNTIKAITTPRCGVPDVVPNHNHTHNQTYGDGIFNMIASYSFFQGNPRWGRYSLTYNFPATGVSVVNLQTLRPVIARAFQRWAAVSPFRFQEVAQSQRADITISFQRLSHGDGVSFDGPGGFVAHAFAPEVGVFHYDADENWSTNPNPNQMDLESIAVHEIGHILGLHHSQYTYAIMYPTLSFGTIKRELTSDETTGLRVLYGY